MSEILRPDGRRFGAVELARDGTGPTLRAAMLAGTAPALTSLVGFEWDGFNTTPFAGILGIRRFRKGFFEAPPGSTGPSPAIHGFNIPVRRDPWDMPHRCRPSDEQPRRFGFFRVHSVVPGARDAHYPNALLLDYALGGNPWWAPERVLRDYLVQVYADDDSLLLGRAFVALAGLRVHVSYFVLRRARRHSFTGD